jgi:CelD/BcsL family acetyltransferase involved in cellulose biosynthesis
MSLRAEWIDDEARFAALAGEWERLLPADATPFDLHRWYAPWWEAFGGGGKMAVCTVWRGEELAGAMPLLRRGGRLSGMLNGHAGAFRPLAADAEAMAALADAVIARQAPELELRSLPSEDPSLPALLESVRRAGARPLSESGYASPFVATGGDLEAWSKGEDASWKSRVARYRRKMLRDHETEFAVFEAPEDLDGWLEEGFRIEASGWKGRAGTAIASTPETERFYRALARDFQQRDELRLTRVALDGNAVAFCFSLLYGNRIYTLKSGYDESIRKLAPGLVMQLLMVEKAFELGFETLELLGEQVDWKQKLSTGAHPHTDLRIYSSRPGGAIRHAYRRRLRPPLRSAYRRLRSRQG